LPIILVTSAIPLSSPATPSSAPFFVGAAFAQLLHQTHSPDITIPSVVLLTITITDVILLTIAITDIVQYAATAEALDLRV